MGEGKREEERTRGKARRGRNRVGRGEGMKR